MTENSAAGPTGFKNLIGLKAITVADGYAVMELTIGPEHLNSQGSLHGGIIAAMIDHAGGTAGSLCTKTGTLRPAATISLTTSFLAPAFSGMITATARKRPGGRRIYVSTTEITDEAGRLLAVGEATYRYMNSKNREQL